MDNIIVSSGSMLMSGVQTPAIPGTPVGDKAASSAPSVGRASPAVIRNIRQGQAALVKASEKPKYPKPGAFKPSVGRGPSTFLQKVMGGHLPMSWLTTGPRGR